MAYVFTQVFRNRYLNRILERTETTIVYFSSIMPVESNCFAYRSILGVQAALALEIQVTFEL